ncbi:unnamed protein product [Mytilus coruscus]|uniref:CCHC-type domain-containing protein n=1 Tax=Mytilus coruscus TaxID=42192 RepID=A0A6J8CSW9_MYTCO|nr:unnamed protein product [Mytilus coruscus]
MAEALTNTFRLPPQLNVTEGNVSENFKKWKRQVEIYLVASGAVKKDGAVQVAIILNCAGPNIVDIFDQIQWTERGDEKKLDKLFEKLEAYCNPRKNEVLESHRFWMVPYQEPFDNFLTELRTRANSCNFQEKDRMMRDKIIFSVTGKLQELLLREDKINLDKAIKICRAYEQSNKHVKELRESTNSTHTVNKVTHHDKFKKKTYQPESKRPQTRHPQSQSKTSYNTQINNKECNFCGYKHERKKEKCPAWGKHAMRAKVETILKLNARKYTQSAQHKVTKKKMTAG